MKKSYPFSNLHRRSLIKAALSAGAGMATLPKTIFAANDTKEILDQDYDVVVVGSGAAGMTAALRASKRGLKTLVVEKSKLYGGSTARSGGGIWIRNNTINQEAGIKDSQEEALAYLNLVAGTGSSFEKQKAYIQQGPEMISFVMENSPLKFRTMEGYPDYYPELYGGKAEGASIEPEEFDGRALGKELKNLNPAYIKTPEGVVVYGGDYKWMTLASVSIRGAARAATAISRYLAAKIRGRKPLTMGQALAGGLRAGLLKADVPVLLGASISDLSADRDGRINGLFVETKDGLRLVKASKGVIMASGGFEKNLKMRQQYQKAPVDTSWTLGAETNTGDGIRIGEAVGADLKLMDDAWWGPTIPLTKESPYFCLSERSLPGSIIVNSKAKRFVNESSPYHDVVNAMYEQPKQGDELPIWMIADQRYRNRYLLRDVPALLPLPKEWYESGAVVKADSLAELAEKIGLATEDLIDTVSTFNNYAENGVDEDYQRGESAYDQYYADPNVKPNVSLYPIENGPYFAFRMVPGDLGTKGGLETDEHSRVLRPNGSVIEGLYAAGNVSAPVMGRSYAGAGSTLGPAMAFGYIAADHIADS